MLAQTNATYAKPPSKIDRLGKSEIVASKQTADATAQAKTSAAGVKPTDKNNAGTMPLIADPKQIAAADAQPRAKAGQPKSSSGNPKQSSPLPQAVLAAQQRAQSPTTVSIAGLQTGPAISASEGTVPGQTADGTGDSGSPPQIPWQDPRQIANQTAGDAPDPASDKIPGKSRTDGRNAEPSAESSVTPQTDVLDILNSSALAPPSKNATPPLLADKSPAGSQLTSLTQSVQHLTHRESSSQPPQAQTSAPQTDPSSVKPSPATSNQGHDGGNSSTGRGRSEQSRASSDSVSPQRVQQSPDIASAAASPPPSAAAGVNSAANSATNNNAGMTAAAGTQNANIPAGGATLHVAPAPQSNEQALQPDLNTLAINIAAKSQAGAKQFDISLDPPELGRVEVRLTVDNAGKAQAHLVAERPETLQLLQRDSATLSRALKESGIQLGDNGLQFSLKGQDRQGDGAPQNASRAKPLSISAVTSAENILPISSTYGLGFSRAGIDIRV